MSYSTIVAFASIHHLNRVKRRLRERNFHVDTIRTPEDIAEKGCGFSLCCPVSLVSLVEELAATMNIRLVGVRTSSESIYEL